MKKYTKPLIIIAILVLSISAISGCKNKKSETSAPVTEQPVVETPVTPTPVEPDDTKTKEKLELQLGNDIGRNVSKLNIRPDTESDWTEISIADNLWKTGYMIPVKIESETIPNPENGWEIEVTFADDSATKLFENVPLNSQESIILTDEGAVFSQ